MAALPQEEPQSASGLFQSLSNFAGTLIAIAHTRLELLTTELQEEVRQVGAILLWAFVAAFTALLGLFLAALVFIFAFWDTHRIAASLVMIGMFVGLTIFVALVLRKKLREKPPMLDDVELAKDRDNPRSRGGQAQWPALRSMPITATCWRASPCSVCSWVRRRKRRGTKGPRRSRSGGSRREPRSPVLICRRDRRRRAGRATTVAGWARRD
jgi:uncharacterized membrane protein YqjE